MLFEEYLLKLCKQNNLEIYDMRKDENDNYTIFLDNIDKNKSLDCNLINHFHKNLLSFIEQKQLNIWVKEVSSAGLTRDVKDVSQLEKSLNKKVKFFFNKTWVQGFIEEVNKNQFKLDNTYYNFELVSKMKWEL